MKIYVATGLEYADRAKIVQSVLRDDGHEITYDWTVHGSVQDAGPEHIAEVARLEAAGVRAADLLIAILPGGCGTHVEIGLALGRGIPVILMRHIDEVEKLPTCAFYSLAHRNYRWGTEDGLRYATRWAVLAVEGAYDDGDQGAEYGPPDDYVEGEE